MESLLVTLVLLAALIALVYKYLTWHHNVFKKLGLAGPKPNIFLGNFPSVITGKQPLVYDIDELYSKYKKTHRAIGVFFTRNPQILILDPELAQEILVKNFGKFRGNFAANCIYDRNADKLAAQSPFLTSDYSWKTKRAEVVTGLTQNKLSSAFPILKNCAEKLSRYLEEKTAQGNAVIETKNLGFRFTSNFLGEFLWGIETNALTNLDEPNIYLQMQSKWLQFIFNSTETYYKLLPLPWLRPFVQNRVFPEDTNRFFSQLTKDALEMRAKNVHSQNRVDFLNHLRQLQEKKGLSHDELVGHILTIMLDGFDTSATVLFHAIFYLAHHPEYQEKLRAELLDNFEEDGFVSYQKLCSLPYLDQCVYESLRLIADVPFVRICTEPTELDVGNGHIIPIRVGDVVSVPVFSYHHNPDYFPKPFEFNPERFNNAAHLDLMKKGIFMPFGSGPRICVGMHLSKAEVKTCLVQILKSYRVKCCAKTIPETRPESPTLLMGVDGEFWLEYERL